MSTVQDHPFWDGLRAVNPSTEAEVLRAVCDNRDAALYWHETQHEADEKEKKRLRDRVRNWKIYTGIAVLFAVAALLVRFRIIEL